MFQSTVGQHMNVQLLFLLELLSYNDAMEAAKWANRFGLPDGMLDTVIVDARKVIRWVFQI